MINREEYLNKLINFQNKNVIKVVTGISWCGKSTLFNLFIDYLKSTGIPEKQIIHINLENPMYQFNNYLDLYNYVDDLLTNEKNYVFIDEVQNISEFQKAVDGLYIKENVDMYITGSNAYLLSGELATLLSGRYVEIKMLPLSFKEFTTAYDITTDHQKLFLEYMKFGGMPGNLEYIDENNDSINTYLDGIFSSVIYKDIMIRENISNKILLENILKFLFDSVGSPISLKKISDTLTSKGTKTNNHTVEHYVESFVDSFLIYKAERFDVKGKSLLARDYKYYPVDTGLRNYFLGKKAGSDMGHLLENIVYLELLRRGYKVYVGKVGELEIDFVVENSKGIEYYQVSLTTRDEKVLERELKSLQNTKDHYPKFLLTLDNDLESDYNGITKINVVEWLIKN